MVVFLELSPVRTTLLGSALLLGGCATGGAPLTTAYRVPDEGSPLSAEGATSAARPTYTLPPGEPVKTPRQPDFSDPAPDFKRGPSQPLSLSPPAGGDVHHSPRTVQPAEEGVSPGLSLGRQTDRARTPAIPEDESFLPRSSPRDKPAPRENSDEEIPSLAVLPHRSGDAKAVSSKLELLVNVARRKQLGSAAAYRLLVRNGGTELAEDVDIHCEFDPQLSFNDSSPREVRKRLGRLRPGESKELTLHLTAQKPGTYCSRFSLKTRDQQQSHEAVWKLVCVEFVAQQLQIEMLGPTLRTVGSRAEFNFRVTNCTKTPLPEARLALSYDAALVPVEASQGAERRESALVWKLPHLQPEESAHLQAEFDCRTPAHRACVQLAASGRGLHSEESEICLQILPVNGALDLQIRDLSDPFIVGQRGKYEIVVQNVGLQPAPQVRLDVQIPSSLKVQAATASLGDKLLPLKYALAGGKLLFDPLETLPQDAKAVYTVEVEATSAGLADVQATLHSGLNKSALSASEPTWIISD